MSKAEDGREPGELTVDELANRVSMTVRNVRAYGTRGLIPPPRLVGRTGYYSQEHVARLSLVREMLDQGYTLSAIERLLGSAAGSGVQALGLFHALLSPWPDADGELVPPGSLAEQAGIPYDPQLTQRVIDLGLAAPEGEALRLLNPALVRAGLEVVAQGAPLEGVLDLVPELREHADAVAHLFVRLIRDSVWDEFVEAGMPPEDWERMVAVVERLVPLAGQALLAAFQQSLGAAIEEVMHEELAGEPGWRPQGQAGG